MKGYQKSLTQWLAQNVIMLLLLCHTQLPFLFFGSKQGWPLKALRANIHSNCYSHTEHKPVGQDTAQAGRVQRTLESLAGLHWLKMSPRGYFRPDDTLNVRNHNCSICVSWDATCIWHLTFSSHTISYAPVTTNFTILNNSPFLMSLSLCMPCCSHLFFLLYGR